MITCIQTCIVTISTTKKSLKLNNVKP